MKKSAALFTLGLLASACLLMPALGPAQAQIFGPSDEEKAHEASQDSQLSDLASQNQQLQGRVQALEDKSRSLTDTLAQSTGANEDLRHQLDLLSQKLNQQQKDFSYRLCMISAQQLGTGTDDSGLNCAGGGASAGPAPASSGPQQAMTPGAALPPVGDAPVSSGVPLRLAPPANNLGSLSSSDAGEVALRPSGGNQYDTAMNLLARVQYDEAKSQFRAFADANPDDTDLAPQAIYWVGNINYIQHNYPDAMTAFAEQIKKYPKSPRGPDSMLKLGQSLVAMGRTQEGCTTLGAIKSKFPNAPANTLAQAAGARKTDCR